MKTGLFSNHGTCDPKLHLDQPRMSFVPVAWGRRRRQIPVHMLGCTWVTRSKGKKVLFLRVRTAHWRRSTTWPNYCPVSCPTPPKRTTMASFYSSSWHLHGHRWPHSRLACSFRLLLFQWRKLFEQEPSPTPIPTTAPATSSTAPHRQTETWARCFKIPCPWRRQNSE